MDSKPCIIALCEVKPKTFRYERNLTEYNLEDYDLLPFYTGKDYVNLHSELSSVFTCKHK